MLHRVKEGRNILHTIKRRKANLIRHILRENCPIKDMIEGKIGGRIEVTRRLGRRRKQVLEDLKEKREYRKLKEETVDRALWRTRFRRGYGPLRKREHAINELLFNPQDRPHSSSITIPYSYI